MSGQSAEQLATDLYNSFRDSDFTKGAVYDISYDIETISAGGAFGGGSTSSETFGTTAFVVATTKDNSGAILATDTTIKVLFAELDVPPLNTKIIVYNGDLIDVSIFYGEDADSFYSDDGNTFYNPEYEVTGVVYTLISYVADPTQTVWTGILRGS